VALQSLKPRTISPLDIPISSSGPPLTVNSRPKSFSLDSSKKPQLGDFISMEFVLNYLAPVKCYDSSLDKKDNDSVLQSKSYLCSSSPRPNLPSVILLEHGTRNLAILVDGQMTPCSVLESDFYQLVYQGGGVYGNEYMRQISWSSVQYIRVVDNEVRC